MVSTERGRAAHGPMKWGSALGTYNNESDPVFDASLLTAFNPAPLLPPAPQAGGKFTGIEPGEKWSSAHTLTDTEAPGHCLCSVKTTSNLLRNHSAHWASIIC